MGDKIVQTSLRIPEDILNKLRVEAESKGVSVNELILWKIHLDGG